MKIERRLVGAALRGFLADETGKQFGLGQPPDKVPKMPYGILYPMPGTTTGGDWGDPDFCLIYLFQVTCVGASHEQCAALSDAVGKVMLERGPNGDWLHELLIAESISVIDRKVDSFGAIVPTGDNLFQSADSYRIEVE